MTNREFTEQWLQDCELVRISFREGLVLDFAGQNELVISGPLRLTLPAAGTLPTQVATIDPYGVSESARPLFDFAGSTCTDGVWDDRGDLHLEFSTGHQIDVSADEQITAWELFGEYHGYVACLPPGKVQKVELDPTTVEVMKRRLTRGNWPN
jgi:hypothetical protein